MKSDVSPAAVGYGLWWTVLFSNGLNGPSWLPLLQADEILAQNVRIVLYVVYAAVFAAALLLRKRLSPVNDHRVAISAASVVSALGLVCVSVAGTGAAPTALLYAGVVLFALGTVAPILAFGELFCLLDARRACVNICISLAIAAPLFFVIAWLGGAAFPLAVVLEVACPLLSLPALFKAWKQGLDRRPSAKVERGPFRMPPGLLAAMFAYGLAFGVVLGIGAQAADRSFLGLVANAVFVCALSLGILAVVSSSKTFSIGRVYRPVLPLFAFGFILLAIAGSAASTVSTGVVLAGYACARIFSTAVYADISSRVPNSAYATAASGALADAGGVAVGSTVARILLTDMGIAGRQAYDCSMAVVGALIIVTVFLLSESRIETLWGLLPASKETSRNPGSPSSPLPSAASAPAVPADGRCEQMAKESGLTPRETEVFVHLARGESAADIADALVLSKSTVLTHTKRIYAKLGVHSRAELVSAVYFPREDRDSPS